MVVLPDRKSLTPELLSRSQKNLTGGFVPTMGALHQGHLTLVKRALLENDFAVVSIYVNPTQFDNASDLQKYPRILENDRELLANLSGDILLYTPNNRDIYGDELRSEHFDFGGIENRMEGKHRPGHFDGVGTILTILFDIIKPDRAYFGEKDFQQLQIVRKLVSLGRIPVKIIGCPIVREPNGLAMSSRNKRLSEKEFEEAAIIYKTLKEVRQKFGSHSISSLNTLVKERFLKNGVLKLEYFMIANEKTLMETKRKRKGNRYRAFIAAFCGEVRLIDNIPLN